MNVFIISERLVTLENVFDREMKSDVFKASRAFQEFEDNHEFQRRLHF